MATFSQPPDWPQQQVIVAVPDDSHDRANHLYSGWGIEEVMGCVYGAMVHHDLVPLRRFVGYSGRDQRMYALVQADRANTVYAELERELARQPVVLFVQEVNAEVSQLLQDLLAQPHTLKSA